MNKDEILKTLERIARDAFDDEELQVTDSLSRDDLKAWDSLGHIRLITATEEEFHVSFTIEEIETLARMSQLVDMVADKT
jgi:acyl carrier protein